MRHPKRELQDFRRFKEVLTILTKEGFGFLLDTLNLSKHVPLTTRIMNQKRETRPERLRETIERLGTTYIKFGQILSERPDIIPERYCKELEKLEDSAPQFPHEEARQIVDKEIGLDNLKEFDEEPIAAASIAQVHRAKLKSGEEVVLKIRRPGVKKQVEKDLDILLYIAKKADKHTNVGNNFLHGEVEEFAEWTKDELDFKKELRNASAFKKNMEEEENVRVPDLYPDYSSEKVLTMEYIDAVKCDDIERIRDMDIDQKEIARTGIRAVLRQILRDGLLHADPHPSNFMVDHEGNLVFLDFGMMTRITPETRKKLGIMMLEASREDVEGLMDTIKSLSTTGQNTNEEKLKRELEKQLLKLRDSTIEEQSISKILIKISKSSAENGFFLPTKITLIGKGILTMEGIGLKIFPDFQLQDEFQDEVEELLLKQNDPKTMAKDLTLNMIKNQDVLTELPSKLNKKLEEKQQQTIKVETKTPEIDLLPVALIISSCLLIAASVYSRVFLYIGLLELIYGIFIYQK
ncbi:MAG: ubiquinone biosynthesis protein [Candidatus Nanohaloarchaea archaeon]|jgi:ubiquinone biosynthesis protein